MSGRSPSYEFHENAHRNACWTPRDGPEVRLGVRRARNVQMDPGIPLGELLQEESGSDRARRATTGILDVGHVALDDFLVVVPHREGPARLARSLRRIDDFLNH